MTILQELAGLYENRARERGWPEFGFSTERIGAVVVLESDGAVSAIRPMNPPNDKGNLEPQRMDVPAPPKDRRGLKLVAGQFWDPMPYALGVSGKPDKVSFEEDRAGEKFRVFRDAHLNLLEGAEDAELVTFRNFCKAWIPERFLDFPSAACLVGQNTVFRLGDGPLLHELPAARALLGGAGCYGDTVCLVTGRKGTVARLHTPIKGVNDPAFSGVSYLVSFNNSAETSHGKEQGENAPVSEMAAFEYGTALNALLAKGSGNSMRLGGDTVAFWADQPEAELTFEALLAGTDSAAAELELRARIEAVAAGQMRADEVLNPEARLFVLGLAPNSARLAVRYWHPGTLRGFAQAVTDFWSDCAIRPSPFVKEGLDVSPKPWVLLYDLAAQRDAKNIPNGLGGDLMRAILTGGRYPATLLSAVIGRIRVEGEPDHKIVDGRRAAMLCAVLRRNCKQEVPMALDERATDMAYLLGRLFGAYTYAERSYQERGAGLRQKYIGAASATPARIFPILMRGYEHNLASLSKADGPKRGAGVRADRAVASVLACLPGDADLPATLPLEEQGRFFVGFYHQVSAFYAKAEDAAEPLIEARKLKEKPSDAG